MNERQAIAVLSSYLEHLLRLHGVLDKYGEIKLDNAGRLPDEIRDRLDGFIENAAELRGLINIGRDARRGEPISPAVANAARLMAEEVCRALSGSDELPEARLH